MTHLIFTFGLWEPSSGQGLGLRPLGDSIQSTLSPALTSTYFSYEDDVLAALKSSYKVGDRVIMVGHSLGGGKTVQVVAQFDGQIDWCVLLDPVSLTGNDPFNNTDFVIPPNIQGATTFLRNAMIIPWSKPIRNLADNPLFSNNYRDLSHTDFCSNIECQTYIRDICIKITSP